MNYDPLSGSNSWSVITFQGANGGGGDTEDRILDNSFEYRVNVGPVRLAVEVQLGTAATVLPATLRRQCRLRLHGLLDRLRRRQGL